MTCPNCDRLREALERIADGACRGSPYSYEGHCSGTCENIAYVALDALAATATNQPEKPESSPDTAAANEKTDHAGTMQSDANGLETSARERATEPPTSPRKPKLTWPKPDLSLIEEDCPNCDGNGGTGFFVDRECQRCGGTGTVYPRDPEGSEDQK